MSSCPNYILRALFICMTALRYNVTCYTKRSDLIRQDTKFEREYKLSACMNIE